VLARGIAVNGLAIMDENANGYYPGLDRYYQGCVAGGPAAFVIVARSFWDFGAAMRRKLIREISEGKGGTQLAADTSDQANLLMRIATTEQSSDVLRPARNEYSNACNVADAPIVEKR
jgi:hypothetical protein